MCSFSNVVLTQLPLRGRVEVFFLGVWEGLWSWQEWCYFASLSKSKRTYSFYLVLAYSWDLATVLWASPSTAQRGTRSCNLSWAPSWKPAPTCQTWEWAILEVEPLAPVLALPAGTMWCRDNCLCWALPKLIFVTRINYCCWFRH